MTRGDWIDARVEKPKHDGIVLCEFDDGTVRVEQYSEKIGMWFDAETEDSFGNVTNWTEIVTSADFKLSEIYDKVVNLK